jgi:hypothetical protein
MKKLIVSVLCALCTLAFVAVAPSFADEAAGVANGVLIQERVLTLPQDQAMIAPHECWAGLNRTRASRN